MFRRKAMDALIKWRSKPRRKCLLVRGQRGIGKTTLIREFAKTYENSVYLDLSEDEDARGIFDGSFDVDRLVDAMRILRPGSIISPGNTLIILDEIQHCHRARYALKDFSIDGRYDVIAAGSLLRVPLRDEDRDDPAARIPIGYESHLQMHGMDFEEFLWAIGYSEAQTAAVRMSVRDREPLTTTALNVYQGRFDQFITTGGMPEAVSAFVSGEGMDRISGILRNAVLAFRNDAMTYAPESLVPKILTCCESVPSQLTEANNRFMWSRIEGGHGLNMVRKYERALLWMADTEVVHRCHRLSGLEAPVSIRKQLSHFKIYMSDTGMLINMLGPEALHAAYSKDDSFARGAVAENIVAECLMKAGVEPHYYLDGEYPDRAELNFVVELGSETAAIEVGSGKERSVPPMSEAKDDGRIQRRIVFERTNIHTDGNGIEHYPLFAAAFIKDLAKPMPEIDLRCPPSTRREYSPRHVFSRRRSRILHVRHIRRDRVRRLQVPLLQEGRGQVSVPVAQVRVPRREGRGGRDAGAGPREGILRGARAVRRHRHPPSDRGGPILLP